MQLFSEIYNCYYQVVARILQEAEQNPVTQKKMIQLAEQYGYKETALSVVPNLICGDWALMNCQEISPGIVGYTSKLSYKPSVPLSRLQKSWLKSLLKDPRLSIFLTDQQLSCLKTELQDVSPLYEHSDFMYFDRYQDGDFYSLSSYRRHFQILLKGIQEHQTLKISYYSGKHRLMEHTYLPCRLEYSQKDDKFRLYALFCRKNRRWRLDVLNVGRILSITETGFYIKNPPEPDCYFESRLQKKPVLLEISSERNGLERAMLHFSCYQKKVERLGATGKYLCSLYYDKDRETELLIQILSFGPVIRVLGPEPFLAQVCERVRNQQQLMVSQNSGNMPASNQPPAHSF